MHLATLFGVLCLRRDAILEAFHSRWSLAIGAILVLSAGIARNYDGEDLLAEPWWLAAPFVASLVTSSLLWTLFAFWAKPLRFADYPRFLGLYWLTAPLAWLYGIPYERFLTPVQAVEANAYTLLAVSLWRVLIIARAFQVLYGIRLIRTLTFTVAFGAVTIFVATLLTPRPVLDVMGGMRLPPEDRALTGLAFITGFFSLIASVLFGLAALTAIPSRPGAPRITAQPLTPPDSARPTATLIIATLSVAAWTPLLLINQPLQQHRRAAEHAFKRGDYPALMNELCTHTPTDYPPNWRLPGAHLPAYARIERLPELLSAMTPDTPAWVREHYTAVARDAVLWFRPYEKNDSWVKWVLDDDGRRLITDAHANNVAVIRWLTANDPELTDEQRARLNQWFAPQTLPAGHPPPRP